MGMPIITFDPSLTLSNLILCFAFLLVFWRWLGSDVGQDLSESSDIDNTLKIKPQKSGLVAVFRYVLFAVYPIFIGLSLHADYPVFNEKRTFKMLGELLFPSEYLSNMTDIFFLQALTVCAACLLWIYAPNNKVGKLILYGLYILFLGNVVKSGLQYIHYPLFHWVQLAELLSLIHI